MNYHSRQKMINLNIIPVALLFILASAGLAISLMPKSQETTLISRANITNPHSSFVFKIEPTNNPQLSNLLIFVDSTDDPDYVVTQVDLSLDFDPTAIKPLSIVFASDFNTSPTSLIKEQSINLSTKTTYDDKSMKLPTKSSNPVLIATIPCQIQTSSTILSPFFTSPNSRTDSNLLGLSIKIPYANQKPIERLLIAPTPQTLKLK